MDVRVKIDDKIERNDRGSGIELSDGRRTLAFRKSKPRAMIFFLSLKINVSLSLSLSLSRWLLHKRTAFTLRIDRLSAYI